MIIMFKYKENAHFVQKKKTIIMFRSKGNDNYIKRHY